MCRTEFYFWYYIYKKVYFMYCCMTHTKFIHRIFITIYIVVNISIIYITIPHIFTVINIYRKYIYCFWNHSFDSFNYPLGFPQILFNILCA